MSIGILVAVEAYFENESTENLYRDLDVNTCGFLYRVNDVLSTGYDHFVFMDGEDITKVKQFVKKLKSIGVRTNQITKFNITN